MTSKVVRRAKKPGSFPARQRQAWAAEILERLRKAIPDARCGLNFSNSFELLIATILSAQCTDEQVNRVTPALFRRYPTPQAMASARQRDLERLIHSTGFFRNKAKNIQGAARMLCEKYEGSVPRTMQELVLLPGVARKTANVVLTTAFGIPSGIAVDTHVQRLSARLGLTRQKNPDKIERDLLELLPRNDWIDFGLLLILHGRRTCFARKPACDRCCLNDRCPSAFQA